MARRDKTRQIIEVLSRFADLIIPAVHFGLTFACTLILLKLFRAWAAPYWLKLTVFLPLSFAFGLAVVTALINLVKKWPNDHPDGNSD